MNNTGIDDEILDVWVGTRNKMNEKIKTRKFNWCAFLFGGYYYLYRKMYLIGAINIFLSTIISISITIIVGIISLALDAEVGFFFEIALIANLIIPTINGFIFYPLYKFHIKNTLMQSNNQNVDHVKLAQLKGGVDAKAVGIGIAIVVGVALIISSILIFIFVIVIATLYDIPYSDENRSYNYYDDYYYNDYYYDDYYDEYYDRLYDYLNENDYYFNL